MSKILIKWMALLGVVGYWMYVSAINSHGPASVRLSVYITENNLPLEELQRLELLEEFHKEFERYASHFDFLVLAVVAYLLAALFVEYRRAKETGL